MAEQSVPASAGGLGRALELRAAEQHRASERRDEIRRWPGSRSTCWHRGLLHVEAGTLQRRSANDRLDHAESGRARPPPSNALASYTRSKPVILEGRGCGQRAAGDGNEAKRSTMKRRRASPCSVRWTGYRRCCSGCSWRSPLLAQSPSRNPATPRSATMFIAALGCNLAWGLVDAVMYLVRTVTDRGRLLSLIRSVRDAPDAATGHRLIEGALSKVAAGLVSTGRDRGDARADRCADLAAGASEARS